MDETKEEEVVQPKNKGGRPRKRVRKQRKRQAPALSGLRHEARSRIYKAVAARPEVRAKKLAALAKANAARKANKTPSRLGVPDGWSRGQADMQRVYDGIRADLLMDRMKAEGMIDDTKPDDYEIVKVEFAGKLVEVKVPKTEAGMAEAALRECVIGALSPLTHSKDKLAYNRTVLEWTKPKPAATSNVNVNTEDWLAAALEDNAATDGDASTD